MELIIVDGCSNDDTMPIIRNIVSKTDMRIRICSDEGRGLGVARQIVVLNASGKYIVFVDADALLASDWIAALQNLYDYMTEIAVGDVTVKGACIFRSEAIRDVGGFDENIKGASEDHDLIARMTGRGWISCANPRARFFHKPRQEVAGFLKEQAWFGYGEHYFAHKHGHPNPYWQNLPAGAFLYGLRLAVPAYSATHRKLSFLLPFLLTFGRIGWWFGFVRAHVNGYGHGSTHQQESEKLISDRLHGSPVV
jgi:glycosyltransferase involved in cell wall biosynthesis